MKTRLKWIGNNVKKMNENEAKANEKEARIDAKGGHIIKNVKTLILMSKNKNALGVCEIFQRSIFN